MKIELNNRKILITSNVINIFNKYRQTDLKQPEAGGILLGQISVDLLLISRASIPTIKDSQKKYQYIRNRDIAQIIVDYEFHNSDGYNTYLGEWHTHPVNIPKPSIVDIDMIQSQFKDNKIDISFLFMIIIGKKLDFIGIFEDGKLPSKTISIKEYNNEIN